MSILELQNVSKAFYTDRRRRQATVALHRLNLSIEEGEFVSLIGLSGCGKTVSLNLLAGFEQPTVGEVLFRGEEIIKPSPERGVVFQEYSLFPWLSVQQNIMFAIKNSDRKQGRSYDAEKARKKTGEALRTVGLSECADKRPNTLSGGMKQRVAIARLLAMDSEVFLMDEPFSALDEQTRGALDESLFSLWKAKKKTIVFVTHNISEAILISSRIVLFSDAPGRVIKEWYLDEDLNRSSSSPTIQALKAEIRSLLPSSSATFLDDR